MNTSKRTSTRPYKPRGTFNRDSQAILSLMLEHADAQGNLDLKQLDRKKPGWDAGFKSRNWVCMTARRHREKGSFAYFKAQRDGGNPEVAAQPDAPLTREQIEMEIAKSARKMARKELLEMLAEVQFCPKCGNPLHRLFLQAPSHTNGD